MFWRGFAWLDFRQVSESVFNRGFECGCEDDVGTVLFETMAQITCQWETLFDAHHDRRPVRPQPSSSVDARHTPCPPQEPMSVAAAAP